MSNEKTLKKHSIKDDFSMMAILTLSLIHICAGGSVVIHAQRQCAAFFQLLALIQHGRDPVADWPANVHRHFQAGEIVEVIVLDNGLEEALPHLQLPGPVQCKVFRAPFQPGFQNPAIYLKRLQMCIRDRGLPYTRTSPWMSPW